MAKKSTKSPSPRMVYAWKKETYHPASVDVQVVGETLEKIEARHGALRPAFVVDEARPSASPLHPLFDWDDESAAGKYRLHQARQVISSVVVKQVDNREITNPVAAFVNIVQEDGNRYVSTISAMGDEEKRQQILRNAREDLLRWRSKYQALQEFSELFAVIDRVSEAVLEAV